MTYRLSLQITIELLHHYEDLPDTPNTGRVTHRDLQPIDQPGRRKSTMTQPSLNKSFDTSLIDLSPTPAQTSFSTTDSAPSDDYKQATVPAPMSTSAPKFEEASTTGRKIPTRYVPTVDAYDAWAEVYDSDGNILQAIDDYELGAGGHLLSTFIDLSTSLARREFATAQIHFADLGCGTGRNTIALMKSNDYPPDSSLKITAIDASAGMLAKARQKIDAAYAEMEDWRQCVFRGVYTVQHDFLDPRDATKAPMHLRENKTFSAIISTLVLEHFPAHTFFAVLSSLLRPGGLVLLTDMHADMGSRSQAGFVSQDEETGEAIKVRGTSWVHTVEETVSEAKKAGFEVVGDVRERAITEDLIEKGVVGERAKKWIGTNVWYGMILRKEGEVQQLV